jgi:hypothetical protein
MNHCNVWSGAPVQSLRSVIRGEFWCVPSCTSLYWLADIGHYGQLVWALMVRDEVISIYYREGSRSDSLDICDTARIWKLAKLYLCVSGAQALAAELCFTRLNVQRTDGDRGENGRDVKEWGDNEEEENEAVRKDEKEKCKIEENIKYEGRDGME